MAVAEPEDVIEATGFPFSRTGRTPPAGGPGRWGDGKSEQKIVLKFKRKYFKSRPFTV